MTFYKFVEYGAEKAPTARTFEEVKEIFTGGGYHSNLDDLMNSGAYSLMGWRFNYQDELKCFYCTDHYGNLYKYFAPNKTSLRKAFSSAFSGTLYNIVEITGV